MPIGNEISAGFFFPKYRRTAMLPIMVIETRAEMSSRTQAKVRGPA
jgi:hypothetical protein